MDRLLPLLRTPLACACAAALSPLPALAQTTLASLPAVTISAEDGSGAPLAPSLQAERARLERVPGGTNLVTPQQEARLATLRDALDYQPGIVIQDFFGATDQPRLNIRGSGIQSNPLNRGVLLLQDGLPLNEGTVTLERAAVAVPAVIGEGDTAVVPFHGGETIGWRLVD